MTTTANPTRLARMTTTDPTLERVVHAVSPEGSELVRYDKAGKWYVERADTSAPRLKVNIREAVGIAWSWEQRGGVVFPRQYGGTTFHREFVKFSL